MAESDRTPHFMTVGESRSDLPLFVFLSGMDGTGTLLRVQTTSLQQHFNIRCLVIPPDDLTSWEELTEQVLELILKEVHTLGRRSVYLCGESFGGCLAINLALRVNGVLSGSLDHAPEQLPQLFSRIILVNPASSLGRRPWIYWGSHLTRLLPESLYQLSCVTLLPFLVSLNRISESDRWALLQAMQSVTPATSIWRLSLLQDFQVTDEQLRHITQPVLLVASQCDRLLPSDNEAKLLAQSIPDTKIHFLPDSGHACLLEREVNLYNILEQSGFVEQFSRV